ncbi:MAG TPA: hypothetical protein EYN06_09515 [Myxococcales bacterium]|nr:hypothetical protein [Myxococcales bacterium]HIN86707.1 hypothetical protein [Myxococcales bacterium]
MKNLAILIVVAGGFSLGFSAHSIWLGSALIVLGTGIQWRLNPDPSLIVRMVALAVMAWVMCEWNRTPSVERTPMIDGQAGQYQASSPDVLGLVRVRIVTRATAKGPPILIFAEAHSLPLLGIDEATLKREVKRTLEHQGVPKEAAAESESLTAELVRAALSLALSGKMPRENPTIPEGTFSDEQGAGSYWGMFPDEYSHNCNFQDLADGRYEGRSSNPNFPARVALTIAGGTIHSADIIDIRSSSYGRDAITDIPKRMVQEQRIDVDIVSGATRTSYILRSAVFNACIKAGGRAEDDR